MSDPFRRALAARLGQVLTPEVAAELDAAVPRSPRGPAPGTPVPLDLVPPETTSGGTTLRLERFGDCLEELDRLHVAQWQEVETGLAEFPMRPDYAAMLADEQAGRLVQVVGRRSGVMVANLRFYLTTSRHRGVLIASEDTLFVDAAARDEVWLANRLVDYAERVARAAGARILYANSKAANGADVLMRRRGCTLYAHQFYKVL